MAIKIKPIKQAEENSLDEAIPFRAHLEELRSRLIKSFIAVVATIAFSFIFVDRIFLLLQSRAANIDLIYIEMTEMLETYFQIAIISGIVLALPFIVYQFVMFIRPGLTDRERKWLYILLPSVFLCFAAGALFGYFVLIPPAAEFLISVGSGLVTAQIRVSNYVALMMRLLFAIGLCFETPLLMFFLAKIHILRAEFLAKYRKIAFIGAFIIGAIITPTFDPINQALVAVPLYILYEAGILLARIARAGEKKPGKA